MLSLVLIAIFWIAPIVVGYSIGSGKNRKGWLYGLLLGWIGVIIVAMLPRRPSGSMGGLAETPEKERAAKARRRQEERWAAKVAPGRIHYRDPQSLEGRDQPPA